MIKVGLHVRYPSRKTIEVPGATPLARKEVTNMNQIISTAAAAFVNNVFASRQDLTIDSIDIIVHGKAKP